MKMNNVKTRQKYSIKNSAGEKEYREFENTKVGDVATCSGLKTALKALQKEAPNTYKIYQRETYYKSSEYSDVKVHPLGVS